MAAPMKWYGFERLLRTILPVCILLSAHCLAERTLRLVHVLYRHGDRSPVRGYPNDPYTENSWPGGFGQLSEKGMIQQYELGKWLRKRYITDQPFLNKTYVRTELKVISTNYDRTVMSADSNLQGLYPRERNIGRGTDTLWRPIPVFALQLECDDFLEVTHLPCPRRQQLNDENNRNAAQYIADNQEFFDSVKINAQLDDTELQTVTHLADTLHFEKQAGRSLPNWVTDSTLERLMDSLHYSYYNTFTNTTEELKRLTSGKLIGKIVANMKNHTRGKDNNTKFFMYSAHDSTVAALLSGLGFNVTRRPPTASCVLIELHLDSDGSYSVDIYFRNSSTNPLGTMVIPGCSQHCSLEQFYNLTQNVIPKDYKAECRKKVPLQGLEWANKGWLLAFVTGVLSIALAFIMIALLLFSAHKRKLRMQKRRMEPINFHLLGHRTSDSEEDASVFET